MPKTITTKPLTGVLKELVKGVVSGQDSTPSIERLLDSASANRVNQAGIVSTSDPYTVNQINEISSYLFRFQDFIRNGIGPKIVKGLDVIATSPPTTEVRITSGFGYIDGQKIELLSNILLNVDLTQSDSVYVFINQAGAVAADIAVPELALILGKIVRQSSLSSKIQNAGTLSGGNDIDAYIVSAKDLLFDNNYRFDDDSLVAIRNTLQTLFAENLFGTLKLSENLTIQNTQGSLILDATQLRIQDPQQNPLLKMNANGVFFYNSVGDEISHFGRATARVGNIRITPNSLESVNFGAGLNGFRIGSDGNAEFNNVTVRGTIFATQGVVGNWAIGATQLTGGNVTLDSSGVIKVGSGNEVAILSSVDSQYRFWVGNTVPNLAPFFVDKNGAMKASSGSIASWGISSQVLTGGGVELRSEGIIKLGTSIQLNGAGSGQIQVGSGIVVDGATQRITVSNSGSFVAGDTTLNSSGLTINGTYSSISIGTGNTVIKINNSDGLYLGHALKTSAPFRVSMQGDLVSSSGLIAGWTISASTLASPSNALVLDASNKRIDVGGTIRIDGLNQRIESTNYQSGVNGWRIDGLGNAEFQNCVVRGLIRTSVFVKDEVHATNGQLLVTDATVLASAITTADTKIYLKQGVFLAGTRLLMKTDSQREMMKVLSAGSDSGGPYVTVTRNLDAQGVYAWEDGVAIVSVESRVALVASGYTNLPYIDIIERTSDSTEISRARLGNINGISGCTGFGLWSENVFLTGSITANAGAIAGWTISGSQLKSANNKIILDSALKKITANTITIDGENNQITVGSFISLNGNAGGQIIVGTINDVYLDGATGKIFAKNGEVGGWVISSQVLFKNNVTLDSSGIIKAGIANETVTISSVDSLYRLWVGNSVGGSAPFRVDKAGKLSATGADIDGTLKATAGYIGSATNGWSISSNALTLIGTGVIQTSGGAATGIKLDTGSLRGYDGTNERFRLSTDGSGFLGSTSTFSWTTAGALTLGGFTVNVTSLTAGSGSSAIGLSTSTYAFYAGNTTPGSAPFRVGLDGSLVATNASITGTVVCNTLTANTSGSIAGWAISATALTAATGAKIQSSATATSSGVILDDSGLKGYGGGQLKFSLTATDGRLFANEADIGRKTIKITSTSTAGSAINAAITYLGDDGGIIYVPAGTFLVDTGIIISKDNICIKGAGPRKTFLVPSVNLTQLMSVSYAVDNFEMSDLELNAVNSSFSAQYCFRITGGNIENLRLNNCNFRNATNTNVDLSYGNRTTIEGCVFYIASGKSGIFSGGFIQNCEFRANTVGSGTGISFGNTVIGNRFYDLNIGAILGPSINDNLFDNCNYGVFCNTYSEFTKVVNNRFSSCNTGSIYLSSRHVNFTVTGNLIYNATGIGIFVDTPLGGSISENQVYNSTLSTAIRIEGFSTEYSTGTLIISKNNIYDNTFSTGIYCNLIGSPTTQNAVVISNNILQNSSSTGSITGIDSRDDQVSITGNIINILKTTGTSVLNCIGISMNGNGATVANNVVTNIQGSTLNFASTQAGIMNFGSNVISGNFVSMTENNTVNIVGILNSFGMGNGLVVIGNRVVVTNAGTGDGRAFYVSVSDGVTIGNSYQGSDSLGTLSSGANSLNDN